MISRFSSEGLPVTNHSPKTTSEHADSEMIVYKVFSKDYEHEKVTLLGMLAERRGDLRGKTRLEAGLTWARFTFGDSARDKGSIFVVPKELKAGHATRVLMKRTVFYKGDLLDMVDPLAPSRKRPVETKDAEKDNVLSGGLLEVIGETTSYRDFYGFSENPFEVVPDPQFFYSSPSHLSVLTSVINGIESGKNLMCVTGEVGTGKTTFIHFLLHCLEEKVKTVLIVHPSMTFEELVSNILLGLDQRVVEETKQALLNQLNAYLTEKMGEDKTLVVVVDEAQNLPPEIMEELGTIFEAPGWLERLQMIFVGAPELEDKISTPRLRQFGRKTGIRYQISALTEDESKRYIDHRLKLVGSRSQEAFTPEAISAVVRYARGFPRVINIICDNAFMIGYGLSRTKVDADIIRQAIKDMEVPTEKKLIPRKMLSAARQIRLMAQVLHFLRQKILSSFCYI